MPHLHLSIQAGDDLVLKRMARRHSRSEALAACRRARALRPGIALGADLIAGFPTESEAMFENTLALVEDTRLDYLHVFPFSARPGTPAARMPQVKGDIVHARAARLRDAGAALLVRSLAARIGTTAAAVPGRHTRPTGQPPGGRRTTRRTPRRCPAARRGSRRSTGAPGRTARRRTLQSPCRHPVPRPGDHLRRAGRAERRAG